MLSILFIITLTALIGAVIVHRRHSLMSLAWPKDLDYYPFARRVRYFLSRSGVRVMDNPHLEFAFEAEINGEWVLFACVADNAEIHMTKIIDWGGAKTYHGAGRKFVCVTADPVPEFLKNEARLRSFSFLHYKELKTLIPERPRKMRRRPAFWLQHTAGILFFL